ncbi:glycosyltransferase family 4 protein [Curtobacterium sp. MCBD17_021]|uniref:glycosyltransferase family 4 protein n=1 Tax=Curtobacterium sp. MCBD17_021 TaxID=2175665 RepID=UPI000DAA7170|nr:glycosyltransferase family 4 protein [Curtobacterium sp. MCBD17_021]PZE65402.1 hypothetical protein DEI83_09965 [Curtobacterium sp. MCBD17_021]
MNEDTSVREVRVVLVADGDPADVRTNSGLPEGILSGLRARSDVEIVGLVDSTPGQLWRYIAAALSFRFDRQQWRNVYRKGRMMRALRSRTRDRALARVPGEFVSVQIGNTYAPSTSPYAVVIDGTASLSQKWEGWALPKRELDARIRAERLQFDRARTVFVLGDQVRTEVINAYGQPAAKVITLGGGARRSTETKSRKAPKAALRDGLKTILFVGVDFERKGGDVLLSAFRRLRESDTVELIIAGCAPRAPEPGVRYVGFVSERPSMDRLYQDAHVFCLPSRFEPFGLVVHEAMAFAVPCVVSDRGALPGLVLDGEAGVIVPVEDDAALEAALRTLVRDESRRAELGKRGQLAAAGSSWDVVADRLRRGITMAEDR